MNYRMINEMVEFETRLVIDTNALYKAILMASARALGTDKFKYNMETGVYTMALIVDDDRSNVYNIIFVKSINDGHVSIIIDRDNVTYAKCTIDVAHKYFAQIGRIPDKSVRMLAYQLFNELADIEKAVIDQLAVELTPTPVSSIPANRPITEMVDTADVSEPVKEPEPASTGVTPMFTPPEEAETKETKEEITDVEPEKVNEEKPAEEIPLEEKIKNSGISTNALFNIGKPATPPKQSRPASAPMNYTPPLTSRFDAGNDSFAAFEAEMRHGASAPINNVGRFSRNDIVSSILPAGMLR